jgi:hypothetical protein
VTANFSQLTTLQWTSVWKVREGHTSFFFSDPIDILWVGTGIRGRMALEQPSGFQWNESILQPDALRFQEVEPHCITYNLYLQVTSVNWESLQRFLFLLLFFNCVWISNCSFTDFWNKCYFSLGIAKSPLLWPYLWRPISKLSIQFHCSMLQSFNCCDFCNNFRCIVMWVFQILLFLRNILNILVVYTFCYNLESTWVLIGISLNLYIDLGMIYIFIWEIL